MKEEEIRTMTGQLIEIFADLQRKRVAHRNIKPANIVILEQNASKSLRVCNFEIAYELQDNCDFINLVIDACSVVYASPLVLE
jgi:serine/threonine protein kinase